MARIFGFAALVFSVLGLAGCHDTEAKAQGFGPIPVRLQKLELKPVAEYDEYLASLTSRSSLTLYSQVTGYIRAIAVKPGAPVKKGALLIDIDARQPAATLRSLSANLAMRRANVAYAVQNEQSSRELVREGLVSQLEYEQRRAQRAAAEADVKAAEAQAQAQAQLLDFYHITAPSDGVVGDIPVKLGDYVTPQTRLTSVDQNDFVESYVYVPVSKLGVIKPDSKIALVDDDGKVLCEEHPTFISGEVNVETQTVLVKTACPNGGNLRTAQVLKARLIWAERQSLTVPTSVVSRLSGQYFVYVAERGPSGLVARQTPIRVGGIQNNEYVVLSGLEPGAEIVVSNVQKIRGGAPIAALAAAPTDSAKASSDASKAPPAAH